MRHLVPTLALVAPVGMSEAEKKAWFASAGHELRDVPADLLEIGCDAARKTCDHPQKIISTIWGAIGRSLSDRRSDLARAQRIAKVINGESDRKPWEPTPWNEEDRCTDEQRERVKAEFPQFFEATPDRAPKPIPTAEEYVAACGISLAQAEKLVAQQRAQMDRDAKPIGTLTRDAA